MIFRTLILAFNPLNGFDVNIINLGLWSTLVSQILLWWHMHLSQGNERLSVGLWILTLTLLLCWSQFDRQTSWNTGKRVYFFLQFGEYLWFRVMNVVMQSFNSRLYKPPLIFYAICQKSTLWKTLKSQVKKKLYCQKYELQDKPLLWIFENDLSCSV